MSYSVECPYCEKDNEINDYEGENFDFECEYCGEEFEVTVEYDPIFNSNKITYETCRECGKTYRFEGQSYPRPKKYKDVQREEYKICRPCYYKLVVEDL